METKQYEEIIKRLEALEAAVNKLPSTLDSIQLARESFLQESALDTAFSKKEVELVRLMRQVDKDEELLTAFLKSLQGQ